MQMGVALRHLRRFMGEQFLQFVHAYLPGAGKIGSEGMPQRVQWAEVLRQPCLDLETTHKAVDVYTGTIIVFTRKNERT